MTDIATRIRELIGRNVTAGYLIDVTNFSNAVLAVLDEHPRSTLLAGVLDRLADRHGSGRCAHCSARRLTPPPALIRQYQGHVNGEACLVHEHFDPEPYCITCASETDYEGRRPWPCATVLSIADELGIPAEGGAA